MSPHSAHLGEKAFCNLFIANGFFASKKSLDKTFAYFFTFFATTGTTNTTIILKQESKFTT